jgi:NAD(P)-dependent dehydrogenase (short-subunit alcohol dehydrogenase family)
MDLRLDGKVALVTGASKGIGKAIAAAMAASGAQVMISSRKPEQLEKAAAEMPGEVAWFAANAGDRDAAYDCVAATMERFGSVDILVNNAAVNPYMGPLMGIDESRAAKTVQVNQWGIVVWTQLVWEAWMKTGGGSILNISSTGGMRVETSIPYYNVTSSVPACGSTPSPLVWSKPTSPGPSGKTTGTWWPSGCPSNGSVSQKTSPGRPCFFAATRRPGSPG